MNTFCNCDDVNKTNKLKRIPIIFGLRKPAAACFAPREIREGRERVCRLFERAVPERPIVPLRHWSTSTVHH